MLFRDKLAQVPAPLGGLALGIASLGAAWGLFLPHLAPWFQLLTTPVAAMLVLLVLLRYLFNPQLLDTDLEHSVVSSVLPTLAMATMVIAANLATLAPTFARELWLTAVVAHIMLFLAFLRYRSRNFQLCHMVPSWFVPPVGIIVACVTGRGMGYPQLTEGLFLFGLSAYALELPVMIYRLVFHERISAAASPTFAIMAAPASLSLAGYLTMAGSSANLFLVAMLTPVALLMTVMVWVAMVRLLRLPFSPAFAAFTFPLVIGATALFKLELLLNHLGISYPQPLLSGLARLELLVATVTVLYVAGCYLRHYLFPVGCSQQATASVG